MPNGVFGCKLHWHQSPALIAKLLAERHFRAEPNLTEPSGLDTLVRSRLGNTSYVWLRRKNCVAQGISYDHASKTNQWRIPVDGCTNACMTDGYQRLTALLNRRSGPL